MEQVGTGTVISQNGKLISLPLDPQPFDLTLGPEAERLCDAQTHPGAYADLLVRAAGCSDYFVHLDPNMEAKVISENGARLCVAPVSGTHAG